MSNYTEIDILYLITFLGKVKIKLFIIPWEVFKEAQYVYILFKVQLRTEMHPKFDPSQVRTPPGLTRRSDNIFI